MYSRFSRCCWLNGVNTGCGVQGERKRSKIERAQARLWVLPAERAAGDQRR
jgi:hypothetical protein